MARSNISTLLLMPKGINPAKLSLFGAVMDVTEAKEAEEKIRLIINTVPGLLWTARPDGWVDFLNQRWLDYTE